MAPYMISVSLMVVALSTNVICAKSLTGRKFTSRFDWAKNKLLINGIITCLLYTSVALLHYQKTTYESLEIEQLDELNQDVEDRCV